MQYSPKLKKVMAQIHKLLKENDIAGIVILHTIFGQATKDERGFTYVQGFSEYLIEAQPSYSAIKVNGDNVKILGKKEHYPTVDERDRKLSSTINMYEHLGTKGGEISMHLLEMMDKMKKVWETETSGPGNDSSNTEQNN